MEEFGERLAKEQAAGKLNTRNMIRGKSANKGKLILIEDGPKVGREVLKQFNSLGGPLLGLAQNPFDDGSKMGTIFLGENLRSIFFKHLAQDWIWESCGGDLSF